MICVTCFTLKFLSHFNSMFIQVGRRRCFCSQFGVLSSKSNTCRILFRSISLRGGSRRGRGEGKKEEGSRGSYSSCVYEMLRQVPSDTGISYKSCNLIHSFLTDHFHQSAEEMSCSLIKRSLPSAPRGSRLPYTSYQWSWPKTTGPQDSDAKHMTS